MRNVTSIIFICIFGATLSAQTPTFTAAGVVNSASTGGGPIAPREMLEIFGAGLAAAPASCVATLPLPTSCGGTSVLVNGKAAPLFLVSAFQVNFEAPVDLSGSSATLQVTTQANGQSAVVTVPVAAVAPGIFKSGGGVGEFVSATTYIPISSSNPALPGEILDVWGTGFGPTAPAGASGSPSPVGAQLTSAATVTVTVAGHAATVLAALPAPGQVGEDVVSFVVPFAVTAGNLSVVVSIAGHAAQSVILPVGTPVPSINPSGVVTNSDFGEFPSVAPGSWIEIYGSNLAADTRPWQASDFSGVNAPLSLDGTSVTIGGQAAFLEYISPGQVNVLVPSNVAMGQQQLILTAQGQNSAAYPVTVNPVEPGFLAPPSFNINGNQYVVALLPDGAYVLPTGAIAGLNSRPAQPGDIITLYGVGFGAVNPDIPAGQIAQQLTSLSASFSISFGGTPATFSYDGLAPNFTGLYQFDVLVPSVAAGNQVPVTFAVGGVSGTQTLYIAVEN